MKVLLVNGSIHKDGGTVHFLKLVKIGGCGGLAKDKTEKAPYLFCMVEKDMAFVV